MRAQLPGVDGAAAGVSSDKVSVLTMVDARGDAMAVAACRGEMGGCQRPARHGAPGAGGGGGLHRPPARLCARPGRDGRGGPREVRLLRPARVARRPCGRRLPRLRARVARVPQGPGGRGYLQALLREPFGLSPLFESELTQHRWDAICDVMGRFHVC